MVDVGQRLNDGRGVAKNEQEALQWFLKAAELGDRTRAFYVALTYRYGGPPLRTVLRLRAGTARPPSRATLFP